MRMLLRTMMIAASIAAFLDMAMAANYVVGGPNGGWDLNTQMQAWANNQKFMTGDTLTFVYGPSHSLLEVTKTDFDACLTNGSIATYSGGNTAISLTSSGSRYFICGTFEHCDKGMKVVITTLAGSATPPTAATPSSPIPATPSGSPTASPTTSPVASPPKTAAPKHSPKLSPLTPPSKSPVSSPSKSPVISPASSPNAPAADSPASPPLPDTSTPSTPPSSANKINLVAGFTTTMGFIIMMLLTV